jgi:hypothetical protein
MGSSLKGLLPYFQIILQQGNGKRPPSEKEIGAVIWDVDFVRPKQTESETY